MFICCSYSSFRFYIQTASTSTTISAQLRYYKLEMPAGGWNPLRGICSSLESLLHCLTISAFTSAPLVSRCENEHTHVYRYRYRSMYIRGWNPLRGICSSLESLLHCLTISAFTSAPLVSRCENEHTHLYRYRYRSMYKRGWNPLRGICSSLESLLHCLTISACTTTPLVSRCANVCGQRSVACLRVRFALTLPSRLPYEVA